jgi:hypothetical protein
MLKLALSLENKYMSKIILIFITTFIITINSFADTSGQQTVDIQKLDERITDIELRSLSNRINFGLDLKIESALMSNQSKIQGKNSTSHSGYVGSVLFRLNADTNIGDKIYVYASAESLSFYNENLFANTTNSNNRENQGRGDKLTVSKAYFDWKLYKSWITFSAGRLPTTQGPPAHIKDGVSREGTYPVTAYSVPLDGFALTTKLNSPLDLKDNLTFRVIYKPGGAVNSSTPFRGSNLGDYTNPARVAKNHQLFSGMLEYEQLSNSHGLWKKMLAIVQYGYYKFASPQAFLVSSIPLPGKENNADLFRVYFDNDKFINAKILSPYLELNEILNTQFDFYTTFAFTTVESFANARAVAITSVLAGTDFKLGSFLHPGKATSTRFIVGSRYEFTNHYFLGAEYMKSSEKAAPTVFHANSLFSPNYYNGNSYEIYALKSMYRDNFIVRLGYTRLNINADLSNGFFFQDTVEKVQVALLSFDIRI